MCVYLCIYISSIYLLRRKVNVLLKQRKGKFSAFDEPTSGLVRGLT